MACHGNPNEAISFRSAGNFWNHRYNLGVHEPPTFSWTLWEFLLHHCQELMTSDLIHFLDKGLLDTIFDILIALLEDGAERHVSISLMRKKDNIQAHRLISHDASGLIESFCCRIWDLKRHRNLSSGPFCSGTLAFPMSLTSLAEKLTRIQALFESETQPQRKYKPGVDVTGRPRHEAIEIKGIGRESEQWVGKKSATDSNEFSLANIKPPKIWNSSPWKEYVPSNESPSSLMKPSRQAMSATAQESQTRKRWATTSRADRLSLLDDADRELAIQLSQVNLSARDQRKVLSEMLKRTSNQQERLFQCVEA
ncbi:hypothetical protein GJ744_011142 [Endocarpon pusillum]|uniref:Uncharacterized protein n=1 Tax=Endocarpon pusillum TaxID=364733 RepID=A0A8H7AGZ9_9EURO|nr:hypothetical protein GJ744_011142 [Endocarpon pusillum]